ncbi:hypothetical protein, conserved [Trypanosoma brucei gambiense DAL972]|uniref:Uncharacterized protein n=1 Tax=Trypanosoma brucei gambiense (strain MHOM/CI/86/DAL972) TaxID=679716 RepID=C9ZX21_TRYB9|nr:hypothetical protein, conserved [Trypanosoma brucei gambiense DAL972]CBH13962.1 hypothetical protein, conserved [Trypanosoma brucei gambiense DAL972]|eukprot:XP_011776236.1 hypothetical protein, conserved [Trypanosoma brucei gambiense DAL972]
MWGLTRRCPPMGLARIGAAWMCGARSVSSNSAASGGDDTKERLPWSTTPLTSSTSAATAAERTGVYGVKGYGFMEGFRVLGPTAALGRLKAMLSLYAVLSAAALGGTVWFMTTKSYVLTTDPDPKSDARRKTFSCDYAVVRNRWTSRRCVIDVASCSSSKAIASDACSNDSGTAAVPTRGINFTQQHIKVNWLIHSIRLYLHATDSVVVVDLAPLLHPYRFTLNRQRLLSATPSFSKHDEPFSGRDGKDCVEKPRLLFRSRVRPALVRNYSQNGTFPQYELTLQSVAEELLTERYRRAILSRGYSCTHPAVLEELLRNGQLNGEGLAWEDVVGDSVSFAKEVQRRVEQRMKDQVVLLHCDIAFVR